MKAVMFITDQHHLFVATDVYRDGRVLTDRKSHPYSLIVVAPIVAPSKEEASQVIDLQGFLKRVGGLDDTCLNFVNLYSA